MPIYTEDEPGVARHNLFLLLRWRIVHLVQLSTANAGSNKTKEKIVPGNSWLIISADGKALNLKLQPKHLKKSVSQTLV